VNILGLDLSLTATGVCLPDGTTFRTPQRNDAKHGDQRLLDIVTDLADRCLPYGRIHLAVLERVPPTGPTVTQLATVHGAVRLWLAQERISLVEIAPATLKAYATGGGKSEKSDMRMVLYQRTGRDIRDNNECDAWWLWQAALDRYGDQRAITLPKAQRARLDKPAWPDLTAPNQLELRP
jgi:Holliday junction resolvasome RuvABC endonuclease subunit